jgi:hypothetical protein
MVTQEQILEITNIIVQTVHPKKVFLIGSYAKELLIGKVIWIF